MGRVSGRDKEKESILDAAASVGQISSDVRRFRHHSASTAAPKKPGMAGFPFRIGGDCFGCGHHHCLFGLFLKTGSPPHRGHTYTNRDKSKRTAHRHGHRVPDSARTMSAEVFGAIGEHTKINVRAGDWLVFNVANNRLRWAGVYYFGAAGVREDGSIAFVSEESPQWSVCEDPGLVPRFITEPDFLATNRAQRIAKPWAGGDGMITAKVQNWNGYAIWGSPTNRNIWLKYRVPSGN
jgi:hypothetical protein